MTWMWLSLFCIFFSPSVWAGTACFEKASGKWLGEYCASCVPGTCVKNFVTANPQYGYTADQIEERSVTEEEGRTLVEAANKPIRDAQKAKLQEHRVLIAKLCQGANLTGQDLQDCKDSLQ